MKNKAGQSDTSMQGAFTLNANNEIIEFKHDADVPKTSRAWITFLRDNTLSEHLVDRYRQGFDNAVWRNIFRKSKLSESFLVRLTPEIGWKLVSEYQYLTESFIHQHSHLLDWKVMSAKQKLNEKQIEEHQESLDWTSISWAQSLSSNMLSKFKDRLNWESICMHQLLDVETINNNAARFNKTCWQNISQKQLLTDELINSYPEKIDWGFASMNNNLTDLQLLDYADKINWSRLINYGRKLSYQQIRDLITTDSIAYDDIGDIINERKKFELNDEQIKDLKKTIKLLKKTQNEIRSTNDSSRTK